MEVWKQVCLLISLAGLSGYDLREQKIPVKFILFAIVPAILFLWIGIFDLRDFLLSILPGLLFLGLAACSRERVLGYGDGCLLLVSGLYLGASSGFVLFMTALLLMALISAFLLIFHKADGKDTLPFAPAVLGAYICLLTMYEL